MEVKKKKKKKRKAFNQSEIRGTLIISFNTKTIGSSAFFKCINSDTVIFKEGLSQIWAFAFAELKFDCPLQFQALSLQQERML